VDPVTRHGSAFCFELVGFGGIDDKKEDSKGNKRWEEGKGRTGKYLGI